MTSATLPELSPPPLPLDEPPKKKYVPLGEQLIQAGLITNDQLTTALGRQKENKSRLGELLVELGFVESVKLLPFLANKMNVAGVCLRDGLIDPRVIQHIPRGVAESIGVLPLFKVHDRLTVAMTDPRNLQHRDEIERITGLRVRPVFALEMDINRMIERVYRDGFEVDTITADMADDDIEIGNEVVNVELGDLDVTSDGSPIISLVNYIIVNAVRQGASDIHIEPGDRVTIVRFRVDGQLHEVLRPRYEFHPAIVSRVKVMARMDIAEHRIPLDGRMNVSVEGRQIDLRVSTMPTVLGENIVMRVLDRQSITFDLAKLGLPPDMLSKMNHILKQPHGLALVTGPTGSGKTTTLYSALELLKSETSKIVTVEDPVEYRLDMINQVQVDSSSAMTFASALRSILRQDPDIIMVGEIRDGETAEVAIQAALTGHLVLSTLHTNDSAGAVTRLLDMGIASFKIAAALVGVIAQRLVRHICPNCRTSYFPPAELLDSLRYQGNRRRPFERGEGCTQCRDTGFSGRVGLYEILMIANELREVITKDSNVEAIRRWHRANGGTTLLDEGIRLAEAGETSLDEVARVAFVD